jgi:hypothetical protein
MTTTIAASPWPVKTAAVSGRQFLFFFEKVLIILPEFRIFSGPHYKRYTKREIFMLEEEVFDSQYEITMNRLKEQALAQDFTIEKLKGELQSLVKYEGLDWTGRGNLKAAEISGAILAYQAFIYRYKNRGLQDTD